MDPSNSESTTIHATAVLVGARALLIRGPEGGGKSSLALRLIEAGRMGLLPFARLIGDDRLHLAVAHGRLLVRPAPALAGRIEIRGFDIARVAYEPVAALGGVIDLAADDAQRLPERQQVTVAISGVQLPRLALPAGADPFPAVLAFARRIGGSNPAGADPI